MVSSRTPRRPRPPSPSPSRPWRAMRRVAVMAAAVCGSVLILHLIGPAVPGAAATTASAAASWPLGDPAWPADAGAELDMDPAATAAALTAASEMIAPGAARRDPDGDAVDDIVGAEDDVTARMPVRRTPRGSQAPLTSPQYLASRRYGSHKMQRDRWAVADPLGDSAPSWSPSSPSGVDDMDDLVEAANVTGIVATEWVVPGAINDYFYFTGTNTIVIQTSGAEVYRSTDGGKAWTRLMAGVSVRQLRPDWTRPCHAFFLTDTTAHFRTEDCGETLLPFTTPTVINTYEAPTLELLPPPAQDPSGAHAGAADTTAGHWLWTGDAGCENEASDADADCRAVTDATRDAGQTWTRIREYVVQCSFARHEQFWPRDEQSVFCVAYAASSGSQTDVATVMPAVLVRSGDLGQTWDEIGRNIVGFAIVNQWMLFAMLHENRLIRLHVTMDGEQYSVAQFPKGQQLTRQGYTVLESPMGSVLLNVLLRTARGTSKRGNYGILFKSNYNGTFYQVADPAIHQNALGYVDFERLEGLPGAVFINTVLNPMGVRRGDPARIVSRLSYNDGVDWQPLRTAGGDAIHLHAFTERLDPADAFSRAAAPGLMLGVGNGGAQLTAYAYGNMYVTHNGGATWDLLVKHPHYWELGGRGALAVLCEDMAATTGFRFMAGGSARPLEQVEFKSLLPSWQGEEPLVKKLYVSGILTRDAGIGTDFIIYGRKQPGDAETRLIHLDLSQRLTRDCTDEDYETWSPTALVNTAGAAGPRGGRSLSVAATALHALFSDDAPPTTPSSCMFGEHLTFLRLKSDRTCRVTKDLAAPVSRTTCACTRSDFECDYNFEKRNGRCVPAPVESGRAAPDATRCDADGRRWLSRGYRKLDKSRCTGGVETDIGYQDAGWCASAGRGVIATLFLWLVYLSLGLAAVGLLAWLYQQYRAHGHVALPMENGGGARARAATGALATARSYAAAIGAGILGGVVAVALGLRSYGAQAWTLVREKWTDGRSRGAGGSGYASLSAYEDFDDDAASDTQEMLNHL